MFEVESSNLESKFVDGAALKEDIIFLSVVWINAYC